MYNKLYTLLIEGSLSRKRRDRLMNLSVKKFHKAAKSGVSSEKSEPWQDFRTSEKRSDNLSARVYLKKNYKNDKTIKRYPQK